MKEIREVEDFLREYAQANNNIKEYRLALSEIEQKKQMEYDKALRARVMKKDRVMGGEFSEGVSESVAKLVDVYGERQNKLLEYIRASYGRMAFVEDTVKMAGLNDVEMLCIKLRYFEGYKAWQVADKIGYSDRHYGRIKKQALAKFIEKDVTNVSLQSAL